jgi:CBS domain-containing membrane protein
MEDERRVRQQGTNTGKSKAPEPDHLLAAHIEHVDEEPPLIEEITKMEDEVVDVLEDMAAILEGLIRRARLPWLLQHHKRLPVLALFAIINSGISIGLMSIIAYFTHSPFIFPSLGPTAFLFFYRPRSPAATPRSAILGHSIGAAVGYVSLLITGLTQTQTALQTGVTGPRIVAVTLALSLTVGLMVLLRAPHPPGAATALIVALGLFQQPWQLPLLVVAVGLLTLQAIIINRLAGLNYPLWGSPAPLKNSTIAIAERKQKTGP